MYCAFSNAANKQQQQVKEINKEYPILFAKFIIYVVLHFKLTDTSMATPPPSPSNVANRGNRDRNQPQPLNPRNVMRNTKALNFARTSLSVLAGVTAGILGLTALYGFAFYFVVSFLLSVYYLAKEVQGDSMHFLSKQQLITAFVFENLFTYILVWTLIYGCVHVY